MKSKKNTKQIVLALCTFLLTGWAIAQDANPCKTGGQTCYFGIEINGVLCGYSAETYCNGTLDGKEVRFEFSDVILKMSALGEDVDAGFRVLYTYDPVIRRAVKIEVSIINGESVVKTVTRITRDTAYFSSPTSGVSRVIPVGRDVIFGSQTWYPHLYDDFIKKSVPEKKYKVFDMFRGEITEKGYIRKSEENIMLSDSAFQTLVLEETDYTTGIKTILWLNKEDGYNVKALVAGTRNIYFADKSVTSRITFANIDNELFARVDRKITDIMNLSWIRVKAEVNSYGEELSVQSLNLPGQKFEGTVKGSLVDGIFEIASARYTGLNAPPFPPDFSKSPMLKKYTDAELMIESDNPLIVSEASRITHGSKDSWEAAVRLSKWVVENIAGAIPGGISAINTLKTKEAECGGHSRLLAAFCRAVGIPARVVVGCMYTTYYSGGFGQHAWTEVYMGENGWVPVDATINESDYIDAGHIRLGENAIFRPVKMEIIDFKYRSTDTAASIPDRFRPLLGSYMNVEQYRLFKIIYRNDGLAMDIPNRIILDLNLPDDQGKLYPRMTRDLSLTPSNISGDKAHKMIMHQYFRLKKMSSTETDLDKIPGELRKSIGNYQFAPAKLSLDVMFSNGLLITRDPRGISKDTLYFLKEEDTWVEKTGIYQLGFITNSENEITGLNLAERIEFVRGEPVTNAIEPVIKESGIEAGLKKYDIIRGSNQSEYLFSEHMLHNLGHQLLKESRIDDALKVFLKNVQEYPGSFMANDALAETYLKKGESKSALKYFKIAVKLNQEYEYGRKMIDELINK